MRINLDALYVIPVHELSGPALAAEKHAIKRRLRSFDNGVEAYSGRKATKEDKRHLRPLYLRLAHVKRRMHALETSGAGMGARIANAGGGREDDEREKKKKNEPTAVRWSATASVGRRRRDDRDRDQTRIRTGRWVFVEMRFRSL